MLDLLEETVKKRDYKLVFVWGCSHIESGENCTSTVSLLIHRTENEYNEGLRNIKQKCTSGHVTRPYKKCNKCNNVYPQEESTCKICEVRAKGLAELEMTIAMSNKKLKKLQKLFKNNKQDTDYLKNKKELELVINEAKEKLKN